MYLCMSVCPSLPLSVPPTVHLSVCVSVCVSVLSQQCKSYWRLKIVIEWVPSKKKKEGGVSGCTDSDVPEGTLWFIYNFLL